MYERVGAQVCMHVQTRVLCMNVRACGLCAHMYGVCACMWTRTHVCTGVGVCMSVWVHECLCTCKHVWCEYMSVYACVHMGGVCTCAGV